MKERRELIQQIIGVIIEGMPDCASVRQVSEILQETIYELETYAKMRSARGYLEIAAHPAGSENGLESVKCPDHVREIIRKSVLEEIQERSENISLQANRI